MRSCLGFLGSPLIVGGDAVADERPIGRLDLALGPRFRPAACDRQLAAGEQAAFVDLERGAGLGPPVAPQQELAVFRQPVAERRLAQHASCATSITSCVLPAVPGQKALLGEAVDQRQGLER